MNENPYESPKSDVLAVEAPAADTAQRRCSQCGGGDFKTWTPRHPLIIHWMFNPGLAVNELILGQRIPWTMFVCRDCGGWFRPDTHFIECPKCERFHAAKIWRKCAFGNWLGLVCPDCGASIPCVLNLTSLVILFKLLPIWWPLSWWLRKPYRQWAQARVVRSREFVRSQDNAA